MLSIVACFCRNRSQKSCNVLLPFCICYMIFFLKKTNTQTNKQNRTSNRVFIWLVLALATDRRLSIRNLERTRRKKTYRENMTYLLPSPPSFLLDKQSPSWCSNCCRFSHPNHRWVVNRQDSPRCHDRRIWPLGHCYRHTSLQVYKPRPRNDL